MKEIWKDIKGFEGHYQISNLGNVRSLDRLGKAGQRLKGKPMKQYKNKDGYLVVTLRKDGKEAKPFIHRLIMIAFNPVEDMDKLEVNHKDGNKKNNSLDNLEWATRKENMQHASETGLMRINVGKDNAHAKITEKEVIEIRKRSKKNGGSMTDKELSVMYNVSVSQINKIVNYKTWAHIA